MSIKFVEGDLIKAFKEEKVQVIVHVVNCQGVMGSGFAKQIKEELFKVYEQYRDTASEATNSKDLLGDVIPVSYAGKENVRTVYNLFGQNQYGPGKRHLNYGALAEGLLYIAEDCERRHVGSVGFPYLMGSDRAGGDWQIVYEMIEHFFKDMDVYIYKLPRGD